MNEEDIVIYNDLLNYIYTNHNSNWLIIDEKTIKNNYTSIYFNPKNHGTVEITIDETIEIPYSFIEENHYWLITLLITLCKTLMIERKNKKDRSLNYFKNKKYKK